MVTQMFAHLEERPDFEIGDILTNRKLIGRMGSTGVSTAAHIHMGNALGVYKFPWTLKQCEDGDIIPVPRELNYFLDEYLFQAPLKITTYYCDPKYQEHWEKVHYGYDVSTKKSWPWEFYWNRSKTGYVMFNNWYDAYGNVILISYDTKE